MIIIEYMGKISNTKFFVWFFAWIFLVLIADFVFVYNAMDFYIYVFVGQIPLMLITYKIFIDKNMHIFI